MPEFAIYQPQLDRMEAKLDLLLEGPAQPVLTAAQAQERMGCSSRTAFWRLCERLGIKPFVKNRYRTAEIDHAILRARLSDSAAELKTEGRIHSAPVPANPHE